MTENYVEVEALAWKIYDDENTLAGNFAAIAWTERSEEDKRPFRILARSVLDLKEPTP